MKTRFLLPFTGLLLSGVALADISYNFVEVGYGVVAVDVGAPLDGEGEGPQLSASYEIDRSFTAFIGVSTTDFSKDNIELDDLNYGLGWRHALSDNASVFLNVAYLHTDFNLVGIPTFDEDGYGVTLGYRAENQSPWEFLGTIDYINVEGGVKFGAGVSLVFDATRHFSVTGGVNYFDQSSMAHLGVRYIFDWKH